MVPPARVRGASIAARKACLASTQSQRQSSGSAPTDSEVDYYELLGVPYTAAAADITRAYRAAMKRVHPDRQRPERRAAAEEHAKLLNRAFTTLAKPEFRRSYDAVLKARVVQDQIMSHYVGGFGAPGSGTEPFGAHLRREPTAAERRERVRSDRGAMVSILLVCGTITLTVVVVLVVWAVAGTLFSALF